MAEATPHLIMNNRFLQYGKPMHNSRFGRIATEESLIDYYDYTGRKEAKDTADEIDFRQTSVFRDEDSSESAGEEVSMTKFFGYTSGSHKDKYNPTYSSEGKITTKEERSDFKKKIGDCFNSEDDLAWTIVLSMPDYDVAHEYGMYTIEDWNDVIQSTLYAYFEKDMKVDYDNMLWWFDYHVNTDNPHAHIVFMEKEHHINRGKRKQSEINKLKQRFSEELLRHKREYLKMQDTYDQTMDSLDTYKKETRQAIKTQLEDFGLPYFVDDENDIKLKELYKKLPRTGRLQYNSSNLDCCRDLIDCMTTQILNSKENRENYQRYLRTLDKLEYEYNMNMRSVVGEEEAENMKSHLKQQEVRKLYAYVGNLILSDFKNSRYYRNDDRNFNDKCQKNMKDYYQSKTDSESMGDLKKKALRIAEFMSDSRNNPSSYIYWFNCSNDENISYILSLGENKVNEWLDIIENSDISISRKLTMIDIFGFEDNFVEKKKEDVYYQFYDKNLNIARIPHYYKGISDEFLNDEGILDTSNPDVLMGLKLIDYFCDRIPNRNGSFFSETGDDKAVSANGWNYHSRKENIEYLFSNWNSDTIRACYSNIMTNISKDNFSRHILYYQEDSQKALREFLYLNNLNNIHGL